MRDSVPDCRRCEHDKMARERFGCDTPAEDAVLFVSCGMCNGSSRACPSCKGTNSVPLFRCPMKLLDEVPEVGRGVARFFRHWALLRKHGVFPASGGTADQAATFIEASSIADVEADLVEEELRAARERGNAPPSAREPFRKEGPASGRKTVDIMKKMAEIKDRKERDARS